MLHHDASTWELWLGHCVLVTIFSRVNRPSWSSVCKSCRFADFPPCVYLGTIKMFTWRAQWKCLLEGSRCLRQHLCTLGNRQSFCVSLKKIENQAPSLLLWHGFAKLLSLYVLCIFTVYCLYSVNAHNTSELYTWKSEKTNIMWYHLHTESKKMLQMNLFTEIDS